MTFELSYTGGEWDETEGAITDIIITPDNEWSRACCFVAAHYGENGDSTVIDIIDEAIKNGQFDSNNEDYQTLKKYLNSLAPGFGATALELFFSKFEAAMDFLDMFVGMGNNAVIFGRDYLTEMFREEDMTYDWEDSEYLVVYEQDEDGDNVDAVAVWIYTNYVHNLPIEGLAKYNKIVFSAQENY